MTDAIEWGDDELLLKLEKGTDRDPAKYSAMITVLEANMAASHIRALRSEVARLMSECEDKSRTFPEVITKDMVQQAWITYVDASMSPSVTNLEAMRAVLETVAALAATLSALTPTAEGGDE